MVTSTALPPPTLLPNEIVINGIYYDDPGVGDVSAYEWIELYNRSSTVATRVGFTELFGDSFDGPLQLCLAVLCQGGAPSPRPAL